MQPAISNASAQGLGLQASIASSKQCKPLLVASNASKQAGKEGMGSRRANADGGASRAMPQLVALRRPQVSCKHQAAHLSAREARSIREGLA